MMGAIWVVLGFVSAALLAALGDLVSEEIRGWLDLLPRGILRLAAAELEPAQRETIYEEEWLPELCFALRGAESRPITRLIIGAWYAIGLLISARRVSHRIVRSTATLGPVVIELKYQEVSFTNTSGSAFIFSDPAKDAMNITINNGDSFTGPIWRSQILSELTERGIEYCLSNHTAEITSLPPSSS